VDVADRFCAPEFTEQMKNIVFESTREVFYGKNPIFTGRGSTITFMEVMSREFLRVAFLLTGVGFTDSNAHSANENLRLGFCSKLTQTIALVLSRF
jgi:acetylornithine deacetylase/succinyl-diaminopimelate desuccinylase-like protein